MRIGDERRRRYEQTGGRRSVKFTDGVVGATLLGERLGQPIRGLTSRNAKLLSLAQIRFALLKPAQFQEGHTDAESRKGMRRIRLRNLGVCRERAGPVTLAEERRRPIELVSWWAAADRRLAKRACGGGKNENECGGTPRRGYRVSHVGTYRRGPGGALSSYCSISREARKEVVLILLKPASRRYRDGMTEADESRLVNDAVFQTERVAIGVFRCPVSYPGFRNTGPIDRCIVVFPRTSVWIQHEGSRRFLADPTVATIYNRAQEYERFAASPDGDRCEWFAVADDLAREIAATRDEPALNSERPFRAIAIG